MNTSPYVRPNKSSQEIWEEFSMSFTPAVQEVVDFAKRIPGFRDLPENDQVSLLKAGTFEVRRKDPGGSSCAHTLAHSRVLSRIYSDSSWQRTWINVPFSCFCSAL